MLKTEPHVTRRSLTSSIFSAPSVSLRRLRTSSSSMSRRFELRAHDRRERRLLEVGDHVDQVGIAERAPGRRDGCVLAGGERAEREQLGAILGEVDLAGLHGRRRQVAETGGPVVLVADDAIDVDPAVGHAGRVQQRQLIPERVELGRRQGGIEQVERRADGSHDDQRVALLGAPGGDDLRHTDARTRGEERHEPLVLDELRTPEPSRVARVSVPDARPRARDQLAVPGVAAVDLDVQLAGAVVAFEQGDAVATHAHRRQVVDSTPSWASPAPTRPGWGIRRVIRRRGGRCSRPASRPPAR